VVGGDSLTLELMQRISREFNQSETTFILPPSRECADRRLRSFTPTGAEVFGAGHNALGAWWWLAESGELALGPNGARFAQEIGERVLPVEIIANEGRPVSVSMTQASPVRGRVVEDLSGLARSLGLTTHDLETTRAPAQVVSTGAAHLMVPAKNREAIDRIQADSAQLFAVLQSVEAQGCYVFSLDPRHPNANAYSRFFNPTVGIWEDPATGSAAGPLAYHLKHHGLIDDGASILIEQGTAMGRTSLIRATITHDAVQISGSGVTVAEGTLKL
jgi:PhzF family phenazine biosynthesis protein